MGLDVYVGGLSRYYMGDWETVIQQYARGAELPLTVIRAQPSPEEASSYDEINRAVQKWRESLTLEVKRHAPVQLDWDESLEVPYFTDKPAWDGYGGLLLWAAHAEHPEFARPTALVEDWNADPAYQASVAEGFKSKYRQLLDGPEMWLPCDFDFTFEAETINGNDILFGSSVALLAQLKELNEATWKADPAVLKEWQEDGAINGAPFEVCARFGFSIFFDLAKRSVMCRLPMILDY